MSFIQLFVVLQLLFSFFLCPATNSFGFLFFRLKNKKKYIFSIEILEFLFELI